MPAIAVGKIFDEVQYDELASAMSRIITVEEEAIQMLSKCGESSLSTMSGSSSISIDDSGNDELAQDLHA